MIRHCNGQVVNIYNMKSARGLRSTRGFYRCLHRRLELDSPASREGVEMNMSKSHPCSSVHDVISTIQATLPLSVLECVCSIFGEDCSSSFTDQSRKWNRPSCPFLPIHPLLSSPSLSLFVPVFFSFSH